MSEPWLLLFFLLKIIGYTAAGFVLARFLIPQKYFSWLNQFIFYLVMPSLVFSSMMKSFTLDVLAKYWYLVLFQPLFILAAFGVYRMFALGHFSQDERRVNFGVYAFQNSAYIPIALFSVILSEADYLLMLNYLFIMLIGYNLAMFSYGENLFSAKKMDFSIFKNAVILTIIVSAVIAGGGFTHHVPVFFVQVTQWVGTLTVPLVMASLGGSIYFSTQCGAHVSRKTLIRLFWGKAIVFPLAGLLLIKLFSLSGLIALFVFVQALMPPAANLVVLARNSENMTCLVGGYMTYAYLFALFYVPFWLVFYYGVLF